MTAPMVIVPVKSGGVKSRLSGVLNQRERREFGRVLLTDVLRALDGAGLIDNTVVVSPDPGALKSAAELGARTSLEPSDRGVNAAVITGIAGSDPRGDVLVIPSDLPLLRASELKSLIRLKDCGLDVVIAPSRGFDGTNALLFSPSARFRLSYDDNSFWNHLSEAGAKGLSVGVACERGLMFDVDTPEDLSALAVMRVAKPSIRFARRAAG